MDIRKVDIELDEELRRQATNEQVRRLTRNIPRVAIPTDEKGNLFVGKDSPLYDWAVNG
jgi:ligand-binding sensor domain-containing protein